MPALLQSLLLRLALRHPSPWSLKERAWRKEDLPLIEEDRVRDSLSRTPINPWAQWNAPTSAEGAGRCH